MSGPYGAVLAISPVGSNYNNEVSENFFGHFKSKIAHREHIVCVEELQEVN